MGLLRRFRSGLSGLLWTMRTGGLRGHVEAIAQRVDQLHSLAQQPTQGAATLDQLQQAVLERCQQLEARLAESEERMKLLLEGTFRDQQKQAQKEAWRAVGDLRGHTIKAYAQNGEEGIIFEIFRRIGATNKFFVEFGVETGLECNTRYFAVHERWSGIYFEPDPACFPRLQEIWADRSDVITFPAAVTSSNFETLLAECNVPKEFDLLSIDIDGNDYWVWKSLQQWQPRVVVIEYNPFHIPPKKWVMVENPEHRWTGSMYYGASLASLRDLGLAKGYQLVGTDPSGVNAFFVRQDCIQPGMFIEDAALLYHYSRFGHDCIPRPGDGPYLEI